MKLLFCCVLLALTSAAAQASAATEPAPAPTQSFIYKTVGQTKLEMVVHYPPGWKASDKRPAIVFFFGGGWNVGNISQFTDQAAYFADCGMVAARADYRVKSRQGVTPKECVEDAKSAVRWLRQNAARLGVDPERIVASGGSSGGHIAACTALTPDMDAPGEDTSISCKANALILFNPALSVVGSPELEEAVGNDPILVNALSPVFHVAKDIPPTLILIGTRDPHLPQCQEFMKRAKEVGCHAEMFTAEDAVHGFFNWPPWKEKTIQRAAQFLVSIGYLSKSSVPK